MVIGKVIIGGIVLVASVIGAKAIARSKLTNEQKVGRITEKMAHKLSLTERQKAKVSEINLERANGHKKAYGTGRKKEIIVQAVKQWENDLKTVLTEEQQKKLNL